MNILTIYRKSLFIRFFEEKLNYLFEKGLINGTAHFCIGQEYIPVIISQYLTEKDSVTSTHRGHGHALAKGLDPKKFMAELTGKKIGYNGGKAGSQHVTSRSHHFYANGISGGMIPVAVGMAFANKYRGNKDIVVAYVGDGGFNEGYVQESLNLASIWQLPILFICENNQYAMFTAMKKTHAAPVCKRVKSYNIICKSIEDNDYKKLDNVAERFIKEIRKCSSPRFIEVKTYRHLGHSKNDRNLYRDKKEEKKWFKADVIAKLERVLIEKEKYSDKKMDLIRKNLQDEIEKMTQEVLRESDPDINKVNDYLYI